MSAVVTQEPRASVLWDFADDRFARIRRDVFSVVDRLATVCPAHSLVRSAEEVDGIASRLRREAEHFDHVAAELRRRSDAR